MFKRKISLQSIIIWMATFSLLPRLFSPYALEYGTFYILLYWVPLFVIFPELIKGYESRKYKISELPKFTRVVLLISAIVILTSFFYREIIFDKSANLTVTFIRQSLYLILPFICIALYPLLNAEKKYYFFKINFCLTMMVGSALTIPTFLQSTIVGKTVNEVTALMASKILSPFVGHEVSSSGNTFGNSSFIIKVGSACSSTPQIALSLSAIIVFYLCCKINSKIRVLIVIMFAFIIPFLINSLRIVLLGKLVAESKSEAFDFWHEGTGSLLFCLFAMTCCSAFYYFNWIKENPLVDNN
mgnify:CR=1 FL=1|tara:strand:- start:157 stop:1056 length:900 start_codon:yes stop_codon:yes gene_type:complete